MAGDEQRTVTPAEDNSETQSGGPEEASAHQVLLGFAEAWRGREIELLRTPINCCFRGCAPEFGRFRERVAEPPGHLVGQSWGTSCEFRGVTPTAASPAEGAILAGLTPRKDSGFLA